MRIISLNTWGGTMFEPLMEFIRREGSHTDIFCFQEIFHTESDMKRIIGKNGHANIHQELCEVLPNHVPFFSSAQDGIEPGGISADYHLQFGLSMMVRKGIELTKQGMTFVHRDLNTCIDNDLRTMGRNAQYIEFVENGIDYAVINFHGLWNGQGKSDTEDRLKQSQKLRACVDSLNGRKVLCGDFNLLPETESLKIASIGMRDLIAEYGITSTRSSLYDKPLKFADYVFVSPDIEVENFQVLPDEVSDHLALSLAFA